MNETTIARLGDIAERIDSIRATISVISDGIQDLDVSKSLCFLSWLLDQAVGDIYNEGGLQRDGTR